jgi:hypothetical protein
MSWAVGFAVRRSVQGSSEDSGLTNEILCDSGSLPLTSLERGAWDEARGVESRWCYASAGDEETGLLGEEGGGEELKRLGQWEADLNLEPWEMLLIDLVALWCSCVWCSAAVTCIWDAIMGACRTAFAPDLPLWWRPTLRIERSTARRAVRMSPPATSKLPYKESNHHTAGWAFVTTV